MSHQQPPPQPEIPAELWMLHGAYSWILSSDDGADGKTYLVTFSEAQASEAAKAMKEMHEVVCFPVRVK